MSTLLYAVIKYLYVYNIILPKRKRNKNLTHHNARNFIYFRSIQLIRKKYTAHINTQDTFYSGEWRKKGGGDVDGTRLRRSASCVAIRPRRASLLDGWMDIIRREKRVAEQQSSSVEDAAGVGRAGPIAVAVVQRSVSSSSSLLYMAGDDEMRMLC